MPPLIESVARLRSGSAPACRAPTPRRAPIPGNPTSLPWALTQTPVEPGTGPVRLRRRPCRLVCGLLSEVGFEPRFHGRPPLKPAGVAGVAREAHRRCAVLCASLSHYANILTFSGAGRPVNRETLELLRPVIVTRASGFRRVAACPDGLLSCGHWWPVTSADVTSPLAL